MLVTTGAEACEQKKQPKMKAPYARYGENDVTKPTQLGSTYRYACQTKLMRGFPALEDRR